jgi:hypothetical protein
VQVKEWEEEVNDMWMEVFEGELEHWEANLEEQKEDQKQ